MKNIVKKSFDNPDEIGNIGEKIKVETVDVGDIKIKKVTAQPGWIWSDNNKPVVKTENCEFHHLLYIVSGRLASQMVGGEVVEFGKGDVGNIPPGHDGWTLGEDPVVWLELPH